jgi:glucokinase
MRQAIGVDVGGTTVKAGLVAEDGSVSETSSRPTPIESADQVATTIADAVKTLQDKASGEITAVGIGAAGFVDAERATVLFAPNLPWRDEPLRDAVSDLVGLPVVVENDANAMAWGEYRFGAGQGADNLVCVTIGTGIGGGIILGGTLLRGSYGLAAEFGHQRVIPDGRRCGCGNRGCWEQYCSAGALTREARHLTRVAPAAAARLLELAGEDGLDGITGEVVTRAAQEGDAAALDCFAQIGGWLGQGLADVAATLDPARFVVGGGVVAAGDLLLEPARKRYAESLTAHGHRPLADIVAATLGNDAGIVGAADLARRSA